MLLGVVCGGAVGQNTRPIMRSPRFLGVSYVPASLMSSRRQKSVVHTYIHTYILDSDVKVHRTLHRRSVHIGLHPSRIFN